MSVELNSYSVDLPSSSVKLEIKMEGMAYTGYTSIHGLTEFIVKLQKVRIALMVQQSNKVSEKIVEKITEQEYQVRSILLNDPVTTTDGEIPF